MKKITSYIRDYWYYYVFILVCMFIAIGLDMLYPQITKNVRVDSKDAVLSDELVLEARDNVAKELGSDGRILLRKSGTEPVIRIMVEAKTEKTCRDCIDKVYRAMVVRKLVKQ